MNDQKKSAEAIECGYCGTTTRMRIVGTALDTEEYPSGGTQTHEAGTLYEVCVCPACKRPTLLGGDWHDGMYNESDWSPNIFLPDRTARTARQMLEQHTADRDFMMLAVAEARKAKSEPNLVKPMVGAVVARGTTLLAQGHRSELKLGEHAEYTILEGKCKQEVLSGSTVYTTLEPCTSRNAPKRPCVTHLINRKVARVVIGMLDPDETIRGRGVLALRKANIQVDLFPPDLMAQLEELNRDFITEKEGASHISRRPETLPAPCDPSGKSSLTESAIPSTKGPLEESTLALLSATSTISIADIGNFPASGDKFVTGSIEHLANFEQAHNRACELILDCSRRIRTIVTLQAMDRNMTEKYGRTLLGLLVNSKQRNSPIYDDIIMLSSKDDFLERFVDFTKELTGKYTEQGVDSQIRRYLLDSPLLFNMILIDEKHAVITYPFIRETHTAQAGYCFVDKPEIVKDLASWFDLILVSNALSATSVSDIPQIIGTWVGEFDHNGTYYTEEIHVKEQYGDCVLGTFNSPNPDNPKIVYLYNFEGHFIGHRVLVGALKPSAGNSQIEGHGSFILKLNGEGNEFSGKSIGISIVNSTIESRTYRAKKQM